MIPSAHGGEVVVNGYRWRFSGAVSAAVLSLLDRFPALGDLPGTRVLKSNHFRTVFHVPPCEPLPAGTGAESGLIAKVYRYTSRWDRLRYRFIPHRALQEWRALLRFHELGLETARPWAVAELRSGGRLEGGGLLVSFLAGTEPLASRLDFLSRQEGRAGEGRSILERTGRLVRRMHDRGVWHRDLHAGNILIGKDPDSLYVVDLHTCVFLRGLGRWQRRAGVAKLLHSLRNTVPREGLRLLVEAYGPDALVRSGNAELAERRLLSKVKALQRRRVKSRSKRCFLPSTQFDVTRGPGTRLYHIRRLGSEALEPLWQAHPPGRVLKTSPHGWVAEAALGSESLCVKYRRYSVLEALQALLESHRLRRAYAGGHALAVRGIPTPRVVALRERRRFWLLREAHFVSELLKDGAPLDEHLFAEYWGKPSGALRARRKHRIARAVGELVRSLHDTGLYPHDLSPQNILVSRRALESEGCGTAPLLFLIDLDHLYLWKPLWSRGRLKNLAEVANLPEGHVSSADRFRGLKAYARGEARFLGADWIAALRRRVLAEHLRVLEAAIRNEGARAAAPGP